MEMRWQPWTGISYATFSILLAFLVPTVSIRPEKVSFIRASPDGGGHLLHTVDPFRATSDSRLLSPSDPTFLLEHPESGALITSSSTMARFKIYLPMARESGVLDTGSARLCLSTRLAPSSVLSDGGLEGGQPRAGDFHTCLQISLPPISHNITATSAGAPFEELEASHPLWFASGDGWYHVSLELYPGAGPVSRVTTLVFACPSLDHGHQQKKQDAEKEEKMYLGLDMAVGGTFGWGIAGANIVRIMMDMAKAEGHRTGVPSWLPVPLRGVEGSGLSGEVRGGMEPALKATAALKAQVDAALDLDMNQVSEVRWSVPLPFPVLHGLGGPSSLEQRHGVEYWGTANAAILFLENTTLPRDYIEHLQRFDLILAGSTWLRDLLLSKGLPPEKLGVFWQCVDGSIFKPSSPPRTRDPYGFNIFSGGKLEYRKGQDLVVAAMRHFLPIHPEARLLIAWHNPWPEYMQTINRSMHTTGWPVVKPGAGTAADFQSWLRSNGIDVTRVVDLGRLEQRELASLLRTSVDVGVFPNRCEGGTNLVAMEAAASGVPLIITPATGQADLLHMLGGADAAYPLRAAVEALGGEEEGQSGWVESSVQENMMVVCERPPSQMVDRLTEVYNDPRRAAAKGRRASQHLLHNCTWEGSVAGMLERIGRAIAI